MYVHCEYVQCERRRLQYDQVAEAGHYSSDVNKPWPTPFSSPPPPPSPPPPLRHPPPPPSPCRLAGWWHAAPPALPAPDAP
jgi:hypothetical protein